MSGFMVQNIGATAPSDVDTYYTYTWDIITVYEAGGNKAPTIYLKEMTLPAFTVGQEKVQGASLFYKFAKDITWEDVRIAWYDTTGLLEQIQTWQKAVWTEEEGLQPASKYKKPSILRTFLPDGSAINEWNMINSWPSTIRYGDLTYTQSDIKLVEVVLTYDWCKITPSKNDKPDQPANGGAQGS